MNSSPIKPLAKSVIFDSSSMWIEFVDGRKLGVPLAYFPRLLHATLKQRKKYVISGGGMGLHWDELDEDISVPHLLLGYVDKTVVAGNSIERADELSWELIPKQVSRSL